jgi:heme O synthase-like polyprenyltransferase
LDAKASLSGATFTGAVSGITAAMVGLGNVDNTSDADKPISTATQSALNDKASLSGATFTGTVSGITAAMVGFTIVNGQLNVSIDGTAYRFTPDTPL